MRNSTISRRRRSARNVLFPSCFPAFLMIPFAYVTSHIWHDRSRGLHFGRFAEPVGLGGDLAAAPGGSVVVRVGAAIFAAHLLSYTREFAPDLTRKIRKTTVCRFPGSRSSRNSAKFRGDARCLVSFSKPGSYVPPLHRAQALVRRFTETRFRGRKRVAGAGGARSLGRAVNRLRRTLEEGIECEYDYALYVVDDVVPPLPVQFVWKNWPRGRSTRS
jgi:hypothetical protein